MSRFTMFITGCFVAGAVHGQTKVAIDTVPVGDSGNADNTRGDS